MEIIEKCLSWVAGNASNLMVIITFVCFLIKPIRVKIIEALSGAKAERKAICCLLRKEIISECKKAITNNGWFLYDKENLEDMYVQYKALGGNHGIEDLVDQAKKIPITMKEV